MFNREVEEARREREKRELEWQAELEESMKKSDPTGHGNVVLVLLWCGLGSVWCGGLADESGIVVCGPVVLCYGVVWVWYHLVWSFGRGN